MTVRGFDPLRLDVEAFAKDAAALEGSWPLRQFRRVAEAAHSDAPPAEDDVVAWRARGERRRLPGSESQTWLHLEAQSRLSMECQRCLGPVAVALDVRRSLMFVAGEDAAALLDADSEHDVLVMSRALDVRELIEDELLLALPLVPRHETCLDPLPVSPPLPAGHEEPSPFAALAALRRGGALN